jgi:hypothetical protein
MGGGRVDRDLAYKTAITSTFCTRHGDLRAGIHRNAPKTLILERVRRPVATSARALSPRRARAPGPRRAAQRLHARPGASPGQHGGPTWGRPSRLCWSECGGYEIRTREGFIPTRFPSVRPRPLGESSAGNDTEAPAARAPGLAACHPRAGCCGSSGTVVASPSCGVHLVNLPRAGRQQG